MALCAVTGIVFDVIDIDPRNGGTLSLKRMARDLGDEGPEVYWEVATASGGKHLYIAPLNIGTRPGFLAGIDLKGGMRDGTSRGFVFLPPTVRPSKAENNTGARISYRAKSELCAISGSTSISAIKKYIEEKASEGKVVDGKVVSSPREQISALKKACIGAPAGGQRGALLSYTYELERKGYERNDILILLAALIKEMPVYDQRKPWRAADLRGLLHKAGEVIGDATDDEIKALAPKMRRGKQLQSYDTVIHEKTVWGWPRYIAMGDATIIDGDAGVGKSLATLDVAARWSSGRPMPGEAESFLDPMPVLLLAPEDRAAVTAGRLQAALADPGSVWRPKLGTMEIERRGSKEKRATLDGDIMVFPDAIRQFREWIGDYGVKLVVIDPISAFLSEKTNSNNDASVRRALEPLCVVLGEFGCASLMIRHLNKNTATDAKYRGGGSVAFGAVSRIQLFAGEVPDGTGRFGIAQIKNNHLQRRPDEVLTYEIVDSTIVADDEGNMVPRILWGDHINLSLRALAGGERRGPKPERRHEISQVLEDLFAQRDTWPVKEAEAALRAAGVSINEKTVASARADLGIRAKPSFSEQGGVSNWVWTTAAQKYKRNG